MLSQAINVQARAQTWACFPKIYKLKKRYSFKITCLVFGEFSCLFHGNNFFCAFPHCACLALLARFALGLRSPEKREKIAPVMQGISVQANCLPSQPCFWKIWSFHVNKIKLFRQVFQQNGKLPPSKIPGGPGGTPYNGLYGKAPSESSSF